MAKTLSTGARTQRSKQTEGPLRKSKPGPTKEIQRKKQNNEFPVGKVRFESVMSAAEQSGLLSDKSSRIGGRVSPALVKQAKRLTGIETDTDLIEFALATIALEDNFVEVFKESRGKVDRDLKLGFRRGGI